MKSHSDFSPPDTAIPPGIIPIDISRGRGILPLSACSGDAICLVSPCRFPGRSEIYTLSKRDARAEHLRNNKMMAIHSLARARPRGLFTIAAVILAILCYGPNPGFAAPPLDCDSLEDALRVNTDTVRLETTWAAPGDSIWIPFYFKNDSVLSAFSFLYIFDTSLLAPIVDPDTVIKCQGVNCDTTVYYYIRCAQSDRADSGGVEVRGVYEYIFPNIARLLAIPSQIEIDSIAPGAGQLCWQQFRVKTTAGYGCVGDFAFITWPVWAVDTSVNPPDSVFIACRLNEFASIWTDYPVQIVPTLMAGYFKVGATPNLACGDADGDGAFSIADATFIIAYIFQGGAAPCLVGGVGDVNCDGDVSISDVVSIIANIFGNGPAPCCP